MNKLFHFSLAALLLAAAPAAAQLALPQQGGEPLPLKQVIAPTKDNAPRVSVRRMATAAPAAASGYTGRTFYGNLVNSDDWNGASIGAVPYGIYSYTVGNNADFTAVATNLGYNFMASAYGRNRLVGVYPMSLMGALTGVRYFGLGGTDFAEQWEEVYEGVSYGYIPTVMAYDPTSDKFYAGLYTDGLDGINWAVFNEKTRKFDVLHKWNNRFQPVTLAFTPDGRLFCIGLDGGYYELDKATGEASLLAELSVTPANYVQSMGYDARTDKFVWAAVTATGNELYSVDVETGDVAAINTFKKNEQLSSLFFLSNEAQDAAPAAITDMAFSFSGTAATSGNLTFTVPTTTYAGTALTGAVLMTVYVDGQAVKTGESVQPGAQQTIAVDFTNDNHYVNVVLKNAAGFSPNNYLYEFVGYDTPLAPTAVTFTDDKTAGTFSVTWTAPTAGENNGFIDQANLKYDVTRMPDSVVVAKGISATSFTEAAPAKLARYSYRVAAVNNDKTGDYAASNDILSGTAYGVPYEEDFATDETQSLFTVIDGSGEGTTWRYNSYNHSMDINTTSWDIETASNDWLITPAISLEQGLTYALIYNMRNTYSGSVESARIMIGTNPADTTTFKELGRYDAIDTKGGFTDFETDFSVETAGAYYLALVCTSAKANNCSGLYVQKITVDAQGLNGAPAAPENVTVTPNEEGDMEATVSFTVPTKTLTGDDLTGTLTANLYRDDAKTPFATLDNLTAGSQASYTDKAVTGVGSHKYSVSATNSVGEGKKASAKEFIGVYKPTYTNEFNSEDDAQFFTTYIDGVAQESTSYNRWSYSSYSKNLGLSYWPSNPPTTIDLAFPAIKLGEDSVYAVSFVWNHNFYGNYDVPAELAYSRSADLSNGVTVGALPATDYGENYKASFDLVSGTSGKYFPYIRVTANDQVYLMPNIDSLVISTVGSAKAPYTVTNLNVTAAAEGALKATVSCNAPTTDYAGRALSGTLDVKVFRGNNTTIPVHTFSGVEPGAALSWTDETAQQGNDVYMLLPVNSYGNGKALTDTCYVGIDYPVAVKNLKAVGDAANTGVKLTWDASEGGVYGGYLGTSLAYNVVEYFPNETETSKMMKVLGQTKNLTYELKNVETADSQAVHYYFIFPQTSTGVGAYTYAYSVLGKPYELPFKESFTNGAETTNVWLAGSDHQYSEWSEPQDGETYASQDGDNGMALFYFGSYYTQPTVGTLVTPKFRTDKDAYVTFYLYRGIAKAYDKSAYLVVEQNANDGDYAAISDTLKIDDATTEGWQKITLPLSVADGSTYATLRFVAGVSGMSDYVFIDNITISSPTADAIQGIAADRAGIRATKNGISFLGEAGQSVCIYAANGAMVDRFVTTGNDIRTLSAGIYLVKTAAGQTQKVIVK